MSKFIRTYYNNDKVILKFTGCNDCPLMRLNPLTFSCQCRYYTSPFNNNIVKDFASVYYYKNIKNIEHITFPDWCKLPNTVEEIKKSSHTFRLMEYGISVNTKDTNIDNVTIIDTFDVSYNINNVNGYSSLPCIKKTPIPTSIPLPASFTFNNFDKKPKFQCCSLCGEEDESVDRNKYYGMCESCIELNQNDKIKLNQAYINNFRLKRRIKIETNIQFKSLIEHNYL